MVKPAAPSTEAAPGGRHQQWGDGAHWHKLLKVGQVHVQDEVEVHALPKIQAGLLPQVCRGHDARRERSPAFAAAQAVLTWSAKSGGRDMHALELMS